MRRRLHNQSGLIPFLRLYFFSGRKLEDEHQLYIRKLRETPKACSYRDQWGQPIFFFLVQQVG